MNQQQIVAKGYLMQAYRIDQRINSKIDQLATLKELAAKTNYTLSDMPGNPNKGISKIENTVVKIVSLGEEITREVNALLDVKRDIMDRIRGVTDPEGQLILEQRYLLFYRWEDIAGDLGYTVRQVLRIHDKALLDIDITF